MSQADRDILRRRDAPSTDWLGSTSRYDLTLAAIPLSLLASASLGLAGTLDTHLALGLGSLVCTVLMADALFVNPPR